MRAKTGISRIDASQHDRLTLLSTAEEGSVVLEREVDIDQLRTSQKLHDHTRSDNGGDTEFHEGTTVRSHDSSKPVKRVGRVRRHDPIQWDLRTDEEDKQGGGCP